MKSLIRRRFMVGTRNNERLCFTCRLIEYIGRRTKRKRVEIADYLGKERIEKIYRFSDYFADSSMRELSEKFIMDCNIPEGDFDNVKECTYIVPDYQEIGEVYERLIEDSYEDENIVKGIWEVYHSWIDAHISDYNTDFYCQSREYIAVCYEEGRILP